MTGPVLADSEEEAREILALLETCPVARPREGRAPVRPRAHGGPVRRACTRTTPTTTATPSTTCGPTRRSRSCSRAAPHRRDAARGRLAHALDELGAVASRHARRAPTWPTASRTRSTSRSTRSGRTRSATPRTPRGRATTWRRWRRWRPASSSPTRTSGERPRAVPQRRARRALRRDPRGLRPGRALPHVDGPAVSRRPRRVPRAAARAAATPTAIAAIERGPDGPGAGAAARATSTGCSTPSRCRSRPAGARCPDGVSYVAVRTPMPGVTAEMVDWWFDWHPRDPLRYRVWHPAAHRSNRVEQPATRRREGALGDRAPSRRGRRHRRRPRADRVLRADRARLLDRRARRPARRHDRLRPRRRRPAARPPLGDGARLAARRRRARPAQPLLARRGAAARPPGRARRRGARGSSTGRSCAAARCPTGCRRQLARHCAEEYANLAALLPELHARVRRSGRQRRPKRRTSRATPSWQVQRGTFAAGGKADEPLGRVVRPRSRRGGARVHPAAAPAAPPCGRPRRRRGETDRRRSRR